MTTPDLSRLLATTTRKFFKAASSAAPGPLVMIELAALWAEADELLQKEGGRELIACGPGCGSCCVVNVAVSLPEGIAIARELKRLPSDRLARQRERLDRLWREVRGLDDEDRMIARRPCAFLDDDGNCGIYPVRPLLCRSVTSTDPALCRAAVNQQVFGTTAPVVMHQFQQQLYESLFTGMTAGLEQAGRDGRSFPLSGLVRFLLGQADPEGVLSAAVRLTWDDLYP